MWKLIFVASLLALADGAALVRFINTVPTRTSNPSVNAASKTTTVTGRLVGLPVIPAAADNGLADLPSYNAISDRVGLHYYPTTTSTPSVVWTTLLEANEVGTNTAPFYWYHAMPALRGYHALAAAVANVATETAATDKPLGTLVAAENVVTNAAQPIDQFDLYDQSRLRADGVGLYLSFAPGQYRFEAYGVISDATTVKGGVLADADLADQTKGPLFTQTPNKFTTSSTTFTFEDNKVYTLIAYGNAAFDATVPYTGANVKLTLLTEDISATTFGKASLRFFHGIQSEAANNIDIYQGDIIIVNKKIASGIAFGSVSSYVDVAPSAEVELQVGVPGSAVRAVATGTAVKREVRAGSRLTVICAINDLTTKTVFCRGVPSRVVAYVRLLNDLSAQKSIVQGKFFPQKLSDTPISLWASSEVPRGDQVYEQSQVIGNSVFTNHPLTTEGLYPVINNVAAGTVSGYGEVFVPLPIMDFAIRWVVTAAFDYAFTSTYSKAAFADRTLAAVAGGKSPANPILLAETHYWFSPVLKRVNFLVKTNGGSTLTGMWSSRRGIHPFVLPTTATRGFLAGTTGAAGDSKTLTPAFSTTVDEYVEPGQYYTIFVYPAKSYGSAEAAKATRFEKDLSGAVTAYEDAAILRIAIRLDHTMATTATASTLGIAAPITSGKGLVSFVPFFQRESGGTPTITQQAFTGAASFKQGTTEVLAVSATTMAATYGLNRAFVMRNAEGALDVATVAATSNVGATLSATASGGVDAQLTAAANGDAAYFSLNVGTSTLTYTLAASTCYSTIPSGQSITVTDQSVTDIFVLNAYGCLEASTSGDTSVLTLLSATRASATTTGHSPITKRSVESEVAVPLYNSAAINGSSFLLALAALVLALFAF